MIIVFLPDMNSMSKWKIDGYELDMDPLKNTRYKPMKHVNHYQYLRM